MRELLVLSIFTVILFSLIGDLQKGDLLDSGTLTDVKSEEERLRWDQEAWVFEYIRKVNPQVEVQIAERLAELIVRSALNYEHNPFLIASLIKEESYFDSAALSSTGAIGLMQILPSTARRFDEQRDLWEPSVNLDFGCCYLGVLIEKHSLRRALIIYNEGYSYGEVGKRFARRILSRTERIEEKFEKGI